MATLLLRWAGTAVGTPLGGPLGGALGAVGGAVVDTLLVGGRHRSRLGRGGVADRSLDPAGIGGDLHITGTVPAFGGTPSDDTVVQAIQAMAAAGLRVMFHPFIMMDVPPGNRLPGQRAAERISSSSLGEGRDRPRDVSSSLENLCVTRSCGSAGNSR